MSAQRREIYTSSSGDSWYLCREPEGQPVVSHVPNIASGGKPSSVDLAAFLAKQNQGPEHQALRELIGDLVEADFPRYSDSLGTEEKSPS
jgi:hypothetical protein